ncbi:MAG: S-layer homology domain-containing protein [Butyricicoccus sp.]
MKIKRFFALLLTLTLLLGLMPAYAVSESELQAAVNQSAAYMLKTVKSPGVGSIGGEWAVIGLARSGYDVPQSYWDNYYQVVEETVAACGGVLHERKYTEYSRVVLALTAIGADPTDVAGYDLLMPLGDFDKTIWQGVNGPVWALIALDSGGYEIPVNPAAATQATRQMYVDEILSHQLPDGGWALNGDVSDPDMTGMALQALANYRSQPAVKSAVERAVACLSAMQDRDGGYSSYDTANSESIVQVIVALTALGIDLDDPRFVKDGTLLDSLLRYQQPDGSFRHTADGEGNNQMSTEQGLYGLAAALRAAQGKTCLYEMSDVEGTMADSTAPAAGLPGKHADVKSVPVTAANATFSDLSGHESQAAVEELASRTIISGKGDGTYAPDATMTRAEFAVIVVRALGLEGKTTNAFTDVSAGQWYAPYIGTASTYGVISGVGGGKFNPYGTITRQEAASMVARAARLCGMDTGLGDDEIRNTLAQFGDYVTVASWAKESVAFCYRADILDQSDLEVAPTAAIRRGEIAQMLYNLLSSAKLL